MFLLLSVYGLARQEESKDQWDQVRVLHNNIKHIFGNYMF